MPRVVSRLAFVVLVALTACTEGGAQQEPSPAEVLQALEEKLLTRSEPDLQFMITASGAYPAEIEGRLKFEGDKLILAADGTFNGQPVQLRLASDGHTLYGGNGVEEFKRPAPGHLREALLIGLTRMGVLHNLARLNSGQPPDRMDGGVRDWVTVHNVDYAIPLAADEPVGNILVFAIRVAGTDAAKARLTLDPHTRLPTQRLQTVRFQGGEMRVMERYWFQ